MAAAPVFIAAGFDPTVLDQVDDDRTGAGTYDTLVTAGASGARFSGLLINAVTATQDCKILLFHYNGSVNRYIGEVNVNHLSPSNEQDPFSTVWLYPGGWRILDTTDQIRGSITHGSSQIFHCVGLGGNL